MKQLWYGGTIYTMKREGNTIQSVLVENGKIVDIGTVQDLMGQADEKINLDGAVMFPGFVDSHLHMIGHGEKLMRIDLAKVSSAKELLEVVKEASRDLKNEEWLIAEGWDENLFSEKQLPTLKELDGICDNPVVLKRVCRHAMLANSKALLAGGINEMTPNPPGGEIVRDKDGKLTGLLLDQALYKVLEVIPHISEDYLTRALEISVDHMLSLGLTGGHTEDMSYYGHFSNPMKAFQNVIGTKKHFRAHLLRHHLVFEEMVHTAKYAEPWFEPGAMKIFIDGALGGRTALLSTPYEDDPENSGIAIHTDHEVQTLVQLARKHGEAIAVHVIGDLAMEKVLDVIEKYPVNKDKKDRLIHCSVLRPDLIERMAKLPVILDIQPSFVLSDFPWVEDRLGKERLHHSFQLKTFLEKGMICAGGSDAPIEEVDPKLGIYAAVTRKKPNDHHEGYVPKEKVSRFEAIQLYTSGSAKAIGKEDTRGLIQKGFDADFTIFDRDLFSGEVQQILDAQVVMTVVDGRVVYHNDSV